MEAAAENEVDTNANSAVLQAELQKQAKLNKVRRTKDIGTYRQVPKVSWNALAASNFNPDGRAEVDWASLYPVKEVKAATESEPAQNNPVGIMSPRQAAKMFYDGIWLIEQTEKNPKFLQDRLPEMAHKAYKRKQFQKQTLEAMRRVCCRLAKGLEFSPNCVGEDVFVRILLNQQFELGWRRIERHIVDLPECTTDRDFSKVNRVLSSGEVELLWRGADAVTAAQSSSKQKKDKQSNGTILDCRTWFTGYNNDETNLLDHVIAK